MPTASNGSSTSEQCLSTSPSIDARIGVTGVGGTLLSESSKSAFFVGESRAAWSEEVCTCALFAGGKLVGTKSVRVGISLTSSTLCESATHCEAAGNDGGAHAYASSVEWQRLRNERGERECLRFLSPTKFSAKFSVKDGDGGVSGTNRSFSLSMSDTGGNKSSVAASAGNSLCSIRSRDQMSRSNRLWPFSD